MSPKSRGTPVSACLQSRSTPDLAAPRTPANELSHEPSHEPNLHVIPTSSAPHTPSIEHGSGNQDDALFETEDSESSGSNDVDDVPRIQRRLHTSRSHGQLPHTTSTLFPPFYNRPPLPLPPSPSLTSLLRPSFSTTTSRRTTPESSDVDLASTVATGTSTTNLASITKSARHAPLVPRASPKVPTYEYYGFALYLASSSAFLLYIVWAYVPSPLLHQMGIHYYPNRWWALAVPCWLVALVIYIYVALASYNTQHLTLPMSSCENLVDETAQIALIDKRNGKIVRDGSSQARGSGDTRPTSVAGSQVDTISVHRFSPDQEVDWKSYWSISTDAVLDVPIGGVCEVLYGVEEH